MLTSPSAEPSTLLLSSKESGTAIETPCPLWHSASCAADCQRPILAPCWVLAISLACLTTGLIGLATPTRMPVQLLTQASSQEGEEPGELAMLEMSAPPASENVETENTDAALQITPPEPAVLPNLTPPSLDLPELATPLTAEDLFEVPSSPPMEALLKTESPRPPQPPPSIQPRSSPPTASATSSTKTSTPSASPGTGGTGGSGTSSSGNSKGYFPAPPYPAVARSRGMQGTVYLSITFGSDGRVSGASVSRSSGYSDLDRAASDWVRRNWRGPSGKAGTYRQPVQFRLR